MDGVRIELPVGTFIGADWTAIASLHSKMARVMGRMNTLRKDAKHQQGWSYVSYSKVADAIREALSAENVAVYVGVKDVRQTVVQLRNSEGMRCNASMQFTFADGDSGALCVMPWESEALDTGIADKGLNKAYTAGEKYLLMRTFLVSSSDDVEPDADDEPKAEPIRQAPKAEPPKPEHWSKDAARRKAFHGWLGKLGEQFKVEVDYETVKREALGIEHLEDFTGGPAEAQALVVGWVQGKVAERDLTA